MAHATETSVKWFWSKMQGAPYPNGDASQAATDVMRSILDACLVDGFNSLTFTSLAVANGIATATRTAGHGFMADSIINVSGATPSGLNGDKRILSQTVQTITFDATGISDQTATGTIVIKQAPVGWERVFSSGNKRVWRSPESASPRSYFRLDEGTGDRVSRPISAFEDMTTIDAGTGQWGSATKTFSPTTFWAAAYLGFARYDGGWMVFADKRTVWVIASYTAPTNGYNALGMLGFGDFQSFIANDAYAEFIMGNYESGTSRYLGSQLFGTTYTGYERTYLHRDMINNLDPVARPIRQINDGSGYGGPAFPSPVDNGLILADPLIREQGDGSLRGKARGPLWVMQSVPLDNKFPGSVVTGVAGLEGRSVRLVPISITNSGGIGVDVYEGRLAFDITGPW